MPEARSRIMLHETLHYFLGPHGTNAIIDHITGDPLPPLIPNTTTIRPADRGPMNIYRSSQGYCLYTSGMCELDPEQIQLIQARPRPNQSSNRCNGIDIDANIV